MNSRLLPVRLVIAAALCGSAATFAPSVRAQTSGTNVEVRVGEPEVVIGPVSVSPAPAEPPAAPAPVLYPTSVGDGRYVLVAVPTSRRIRYRGGPVLPGWLLQRRNATGMIIAGSLVAAIGGVASIGAFFVQNYCYGGYGCQQTSAWTFLPGIGSWISLADGSTTAFSQFLVELGGIAQGVGSVLIVAGMTWYRLYLVHHGPTVSVLPFDRGTGISLVGTF